MIMMHIYIYIYIYVCILSLRILSLRIGRGGLKNTQTVSGIPPQGGEQNTIKPYNMNTHTT